MATFAPLPLPRTARPGGYSQGTAATPSPQNLLEILLGGLGDSKMVAALQPEQSTSPIASGLQSAPGANQQVSARMVPGPGPVTEADNPFAARPGILGAVLGKDNPIAEWTAENRGFLQSVGSALLSRGMDFSGVSAGSARDDERRMKAGEWSRGEAGKRNLLSTLQKYGDGYEDISQALSTGAIDTNTAFGEMFKRHNELGTQAEVTARNKANAAFLKNPELRAAVEGGALPFADAFKMDREGGQSLMNVGDGTIYDPNTREWLTKPGAEGGPDLKDQFGFEKDLYQQYSNSDPVKTYEAVKGGYERVRESARQQTGAGDMGLIYGYMRMLDPGSVVRESEFAMAAQAGSFGEQMQGMVTKLMNGERLPDSVRRQFIANADKLYGSASNNLSDINSQFTDRAGGYDVDPGRFVRQPEQFSPWEQGDAPQVANKAQYDALPSGSQYVAPDGSLRTKP